jgi:hypothetical protein
LPTVLHEVKGRGVGEGEGFAPKKDAQNFAINIAGQQQALHFLLAKSTDNSPTVLPKVEGRIVGEGGLAPKKDQIMGVQYNVICIQLALS